MQGQIRTKTGYPSILRLEFCFIRNKGAIFPYEPKKIYHILGCSWNPAFYIFQPEDWKS